MSIVRLINKITGEATSHLLWTFGDGTTSTSMDSTLFHTYETEGDYTASLEGWSITDQYKKQTKIVIVPGEGVDFGWESYGDSSYVDYDYFLESKEPVKFFNKTPGTVVSYDWTFGFNETIGSIYETVSTPTSHYLIGLSHINMDSPSQVLIYHGGDWTLSDASVFCSWSPTIAYHDNMFAMGAWNKIYTSPDFYNWTLRLEVPTEDPSAGFVRFNNLIWGNNEFSAIGVSDNSAYEGTLIARSADGTTWNYIDGTDAYTSMETSMWDGIHYYVTSGGDVLRSVDMSSWSLVHHEDDYYVDYYNFAYMPGRYILTHSVSGFDRYFLTSTDGSNWHDYSPDPSSELKSLVYGNNTFIGIGWGASFYARLLGSNNGIDWTASYVDAFSDTTIVGASYGPLSSPTKVFVATGYNNNTGKIFASNDGGEWYPQTISIPGQSQVTSIAVSNDKFIATATSIMAGWGGDTTSYIYTSSDGTSWINQTTFYSKVLSSSGWSNDLNMFVVSGPNNALYTSSDGSNWTQRTLPSTVSPGLSIAYGNGRFVLVGNGYNVYGSIDGTTWTSFPSGSNWTNGIIRFINNKFYVKGSSTGAWSSSDGSNWSSISYFNDKYPKNFAGSPEIIISTEQITNVPVSMSSSFNGVDWTNQSDSYLISQICGAITHGDKFVLLCANQRNGTDMKYRSAHSIDGLSWILGDVFLTKGLYDNQSYFPNMTWDGTTYVFCGSGQAVSEGRIDFNQASSDGIHWTPPSPFPAISSDATPVVSFPEISYPPEYNDYTVNMTITMSDLQVHSLSKVFHTLILSGYFTWDSTYGSHTDENPFDETYQPIVFNPYITGGDHTWNFGDGTIGTGLNAAHSYPIPLADVSNSQIYQVDHTVNYHGNITSESVNLTVFGSPVVNFTWSSSSSILKGIDFTDVSRYNPTSWDWTFGDGSYSTLQNPSHMFPDYADYTVTLHTLTDLGMDFATQVVTIGLFEIRGRSYPNVKWPPQTVFYYPYIYDLVYVGGGIPSTYNWTILGDGSYPGSPGSFTYVGDSTLASPFIQSTGDATESIVSGGYRLRRYKYYKVALTVDGTYSKESDPIAFIFLY